MAQCQLKIYNGPTNEKRTVFTESDNGQQNITLSIGDVLPLLLDAVESRRTWLRDFDSDEITISTDLFEVLLAYQHYRRPSA